MKEKVTWRPHPHCPRPHEYWSAPDQDATEYEVTEFIRAFVRLTKPRVVVETGTYLGNTTAAISGALLDNVTKPDDEGMVVTFEVDEARAKRAQERFASNERVKVVHGKVGGFLDIDLAFIDSGMQSRQEDMDAIWPKLRPGGIVLVHDTAPKRPPGMVRPSGPYTMLEIATPRGLNIFQKPFG